MEDEKQEPIVGCFICFENLAETPPEVQVEGRVDGISIAPCAHIYHHGCILKWLEGDPNNPHNNCPYCLQDLEPRNLKPVPYLETTCKDSRYLILKERLELSKRSYLLRLSQQEVELGETRGKLQQRDDEIVQINQRLANVEGELGETNGQLEEKTGEVLQVKQRLAVVEEDLGETRGKLEEKNGEVLQISQRLTDVEGDLGETREKLMQRDYEIIQVNLRLANVEAELGETREKLEDKCGEILQVNQRLTDVEGELGEARGKLEQKDDEILQLNQQLTDVKQQLKRKADDLGDLETRIFEIVDERRRKNDPVDNSNCSRNEPQVMMSCGSGERHGFEAGLVLDPLGQ